ncbi:MAG: hypothetical protein F4Z19_12620 [Holophagales bacterium]|nr:hypothetical protein [Holophagales bacterium]
MPRAAIPEGIILSREADAWIDEAEVKDVALPLYEGRMIGQFDFSQKGWVSGKGRSAVWRDIPWELKQIEPQYLMAEQEYRRGVADPDTPKLAHMSVTSGTNTRTAIATLVSGMPAGHKVPVLHVPSSARCLRLAAIFNSLTFDFVSRIRVAGLMLDYHVLEQNPVPRPSLHCRALLWLGTSLMFTSPRDSPSRLYLAKEKTQSLALSAHERARRKAIGDAVVAGTYGLDECDFRSLLADCDHPLSITTRRESARLRAKGLWRVDKEKQPELRHTVLAQVAFADLQRHIEAAGGDREAGIQAFMTQNQGEGWLVPETVRLADYDLGHDDRARGHQPVATELGPRFYDWQLAQPTEEAHRETHLHARNLLGEHGYRRLVADIEQDPAKKRRCSGARSPSQVAEEHHRWDSWLSPSGVDTESEPSGNAGEQPDLFK